MKWDLHESIVIALKGWGFSASRQRDHKVSFKELLQYNLEYPESQVRDTDIETAFNDHLSRPGIKCRINRIQALRLFKECNQRYYGYSSEE